MKLFVKFVYTTVLIFCVDGFGGEPNDSHEYQCICCFGNGAYNNESICVLRTLELDDSHRSSLIVARQYKRSQRFYFQEIFIEFPIFRLLEQIESLTNFFCSII